jgi:hypothetical protein
MVINLISQTEFEELASMVPVPCIVVKNNSKDGLVLDAYQFAWDDDGTAVLLLHKGDYKPQLNLGDCVRYQLTAFGCRLQPSIPIEAHDIKELAEARAQYFPGIFGN